MPNQLKIDNPAGAHNGRRVYTVSEITQDIKIILENSFGGVWLEGELSNFKVASSGHFYFTLKDDASVIQSAMFIRANRAVKFKPEDGLKVICFGKVDVYGPRGQYQFIAESMEPKGIGAQQLAFAQLKERLAKEGLFDPKHKKVLPLMPFNVGIVTSGRGAAVQDILQILKKGAGCVNVLIRSVRVQGGQSAKEIAQAVADMNDYARVDVIIISRGGGSAEDLWSFNEEIVARAIYKSVIPVISAVGHQINTTLSDLTADVFVETPSAAAKIIVDKKNMLLAEIDSHRYELSGGIMEIVHNLKNELVALRHMLKSPLDRLLEKQQMLDELSLGLDKSIKHALDITGERFKSFVARLAALSPLAVLSRGYSLTTLMPQGAIVKDVSLLKEGDLVKTVLGRGTFTSSVKEISKNG